MRRAQNTSKRRHTRGIPKVTVDGAKSTRSSAKNRAPSWGPEARQTHKLSYTPLLVKIKNKIKDKRQSGTSPPPENTLDLMHAWLLPLCSYIYWALDGKTEWSLILRKKFCQVDLPSSFNPHIHQGRSPCKMFGNIMSFQQKKKNKKTKTWRWLDKHSVCHIQKHTNIHTCTKVVSCDKFHRNSSPAPIIINLSAVIICAYQYIMPVSEQIFTSHFHPYATSLFLGKWKIQSLQLHFLRIGCQICRSCKHTNSAY